MSHVDFRKYPCRPVNFNGHGPSFWLEGLLGMRWTHLELLIGGSPAVKDCTMGHLKVTLKLGEMSKLAF